MLLDGVGPVFRSGEPHIRAASTHYDAIAIAIIAMEQKLIRLSISQQGWMRPRLTSRFDPLTACRSCLVPRCNKVYQIDLRDLAIHS